MKPTSSTANTLVGSAMASVSWLALRWIGRTSYFRAICEGTSFRSSASMSSCESWIDGMPYCFDRNAISWSSLIRLSRTRIDPSFSLVLFCSARARWSCSWSMSPSRTRRSPRRRLTGCPSLGSAIQPSGGEGTPVWSVYSSEPFQRIRKSLVGLVLVQDENDLLQTGVAGLQVLDERAQHGLRRMRRADPGRPGAQGREGDRGQPVLVGDVQARLGGGPDLRRVGLVVRAHGRGV